MTEQDSERVTNGVGRLHFVKWIECSKCGVLGTPRPGDRDYYPTIHKWCSHFGAADVTTDLVENETAHQRLTELGYDPERWVDQRESEDEPQFWIYDDERDNGE